MTNIKINKWIKTPCGRSKYSELDSQKGNFSKLRLYWFVFFAALRDWNLSNPDQSDD